MDDPRPDLKDDNVEWDWFLKRAYDMNQDLAYILHGFRCSGLRLHKIRIGYVMRPEFNKDSLWQNQKEYDIDKNKWLVKFQQDIINLLNKLGG